MGYNVKENLERIENQIAGALDRCGRSRDDIRLMAVSKMKPFDAVQEAYDAGMRLFGESRVQEVETKYADSPLEDIEVHFIGHLQSNKAGKAVSLFDCIESIDKIKTARELNKKAINIVGNIKILLEINTSDEDSKNGFRSKEDIYTAIDAIMEFEKITIDGLMTMAPFTNDETAIRKSFSSLRNLAEELRSRYDLPLPVLSMGMTSDFELAIEEGSTLIRVGTGLFGGRNYG